MTFSPFVRKFVLTSHITFSVGWMGAVAVFLVLAISGLASKDEQMVRAAYLAMDLSCWFIILPFCLGALLTGVVQSLGTQWGLFKHYWIVVKLLLTAVCTVILILHLQPISFLAETVSERSLSPTEHSGLRTMLIANAAAAILVLIITTAISAYKPWGKIGLFLNYVKTVPVKTENPSTYRAKNWGRYGIISLIIFVLIFILMHLLGGGMGRH